MMQEYSTLPHRKLCLAIFLVTCLILSMFYYDNALLECRVEVPTQEIIYVVGRNQTSNNPTVTSNNNHTTTNTTTSNTNSTTTNTTSSNNTISITPILKLSTLLPTSNHISLFNRKLKSEDTDFLVLSSKCKIIDLDPFNKDARKFYRQENYKPCRKLDLLTFVIKSDNISTLYIDNEIVPSYSREGVSCCYSNVTRKFNNDNGISISSCQKFKNSITLLNDPVMIKCNDLNDTKKQVYENVHVAVNPTEAVQKKINNFDNTTQPLSVLFVGIDSISRLSFIRAFPNTYRYVEENDWVPLKGYNKIDDNTFPNLMAILTGFNQSYAYNICNPKAVGKLDHCPILWYHYKKLGFITAYAEDEGSINTFNYLKKGFEKPPTDYYFRPYILATEKLKKVSKDGMTYCTGPETAGERIMNAAKDFAITYKQYPNFGFFWMNSFSHNMLNSPTGMDNKVKSFLEDISFGGVTENSIVVFLSDHGMRFGDIRLTDTGWLEERLPFIYISFPGWFKEKFPREFNNFKNNINKLTCPYDLHMTLQHILILSGHNYSMTPSNACPKCKSLFQKPDSERSCADAGITQNWCTCSGYSTTILDMDTLTNVTKFLLKKIDDIIYEKRGEDICAKYSVSEVINTKISQKLTYEKETYLLLKVKTYPKAIFEATLGFTGDIKSQHFFLSGDISRLDSYSEHSKCVSDSYLKKYCYCR